MIQSPFTVEMIKNGLIIASEEMFYAWGRTAKSPVIYEVLDYGVGIIDSKGENLVTQAPGIPGFTGVLDFAAQEVVSKWKDDIQSGDIFVNNVPYDSGTHLNDVTLIMPMFYKNKRMGFAVTKGHWIEVGGMHFGSWTSDSTDIFQEGIQLPCVKLYKENKANTDVIDIIKYNSRLPDFVIGDMEAQVASMRVANRRIVKLVDKYGLEKVLEAMDKLLEDGEKYAIQKIKTLPKGVYEASDFIDDDGITDDPIPVEVKVEITEDNFIVDFTNSGNQAQGSINSPYPSTVSGVRETYMAIIDPQAHPNGGFFKPLKIIAPRGSIFNPRRPAPTSTFWEGMSHAADIVWKALAVHIPQRLTAGHFLSIEATILGGVDDKTGESFAIVEPQPGGWGAGYDMDGEGGLVACGDGETYIASSEVYERRTPILVERYTLNTSDGTGHGEYRGGFGVIRDYKLLTKEANFTVSAGRSKYPAWGVNEGYKGTPNYAVVMRKGKKPKQYRKVAALKISRNDTVSLRTGGGGGWGNPLQRDPEKVFEDYLDEYITQETAEKVYGVKINVENLKIDWSSTKKIRAKMSAT
jgi:N-methylhydantoinase B